MISRRLPSSAPAAVDAAQWGGPSAGGHRYDISAILIKIYPTSTRAQYASMVRFHAGRAALVPQKALDKSFPFPYREEWNDNTKSNAR